MQNFDFSALQSKTKNKYMKNKNLRKLKYVSGNPQNAGFCTIYPTASGGLGGPQTPGLNLRQGSFTTENK
jgi:hypothetical protein